MCTTATLQPMIRKICILAALVAFGSNTAAVAESPPFDGRPWNISTGNLSVGFVQGSPVGAFPKPNFLEAPPSVDSLVRLKNMGLVANEDYIAWGAVEREPGKWDWRQHDAMEQALHKAGLKYVVYNWAHFPPVWLRDQPAQAHADEMSRAWPGDQLSVGLRSAHDRVVRPLLQKHPRAFRRSSRRYLCVHLGSVRRRQLSARCARLDQHGPLP